MKRFVPSVLAAFTGWLITGDWLIGASLGVLALGWTLLRAEEGPPVLAMAFTMQWVSVSIGLFYIAVTGRPLQASLMSDYEPMVLIGLGSLVALMAGLCLGRIIIRRRTPASNLPAQALSFKTLFACYVVAVLVVGSIQQWSFDYPSIRQAVLAGTYLRLALLYLVLRNLVLSARWEMFGAVLAAEVVLGLTGLFAGFREPLVLAVLALLEVFDQRSLRHWFAIGAIALVMGVMGVMWMSVRVNYRARVLSDQSFASSRTERISSISEAAGMWASQDRSRLMASVDSFIDRLWSVYYPALALARVPSVLPHTGGQLMTDALHHVFMPRIFFPDKDDLKSDSELVRKYSGVWVAGLETNTDIAFGYVAEAYVDYGLPLMFLPIVLYGVFMGLAYEGLLRTIKHRDMAVSIVTMICWLSLFQFETSWAKMIGLAGTLLIYVGASCLVLDRVWYERFRDDQPSTWRPQRFADRQA